MPGIRIKHATLTNCLVTVPVLSIPYGNGPIDCPMCQTWHPVKTVHLWLEPDGTCIVAPPVLDLLKRAGMPALSVVNEVKNPPPLHIGVGKQDSVRVRRDWRHAQDKKNRATNLWWRSLTKGKKNG